MIEIQTPPGWTCLLLSYQTLEATPVCLIIDPLDQVVVRDRGTQRNSMQQTAAVQHYNALGPIMGYSSLTLFLFCFYNQPPKALSKLSRSFCITLWIQVLYYLSNEAW